MPTLNKAQLGSVGRFGEDAAADYIASQGHTVLARNRKYGRLELDLVFSDGRSIVFAEVKTRSVRTYGGNSRYGQPSVAVTYEKQRKLIEAARQFLRENRTSLCPRFDVIEVLVRKDGPGDTLTLQTINHIKNAFGAG